MNAEVLMIDDLGSEPLMQNVTVEQLFNLLNERQNKGLSTVISTNLEMSKFRERYTERIASRLRDSRSRFTAERRTLTRRRRNDILRKDGYRSRRWISKNTSSVNGRSA